MNASPSTTTPGPRQTWSGQWGFIVSAIGSAVGLGNIWRFPGVAYENGGGAFLIPYLVALLTAGIPILFLDYAIGQRFRGSAPLAFRRIARWAESFGWFQVMICFFIAIYYAAILAWAASYFVFSFTGAWGEDPAGFFVGSYLKVGDPGFSTTPVWGVLVPLVLIWVAAIIVLALRLDKGLERANIIFIPLLVVAFGALVVRSVFLPGASIGLNALFTPDFSKLSDPSVWIAAYSQIFFSLSIAFGIMITYSSYRRRKSNQTTPGLVVAFANSSFEVLAGIGVFSVLGFMADQSFGGSFATLVKEARISGPMLSFVTFPKVISQMPGSWVFGALFFGSLLMAGFTSMVSITEVISSAFQDKFGFSRAKASVATGMPMAVLSVVLFATTTGLTSLDVVDKFANEIGIVFSAVAMSVIVLWIKNKGSELAYHLSSLSTFKVGRTWRVLVTAICPLVLGYMLVNCVVGILTEGYEGYPTWYLGTAGWGAVAVMVAGSFALAAVRWRSDPEGFVPWPAYPPAGEKGGIR
ncbi:MAG: sodium-dependent transporter [Bifidobacteriaceae bacterium]|jgi:NSS family neurotransmitter:Na+ symporter|nr:sodium-dependent transporter [Bifidobacteriaceae bacterium]